MTKRPYLNIIVKSSTLTDVASIIIITCIIPTSLGTIIRRCRERKKKKNNKYFSRLNSCNTNSIAHDGNLPNKIAKRNANSKNKSNIDFKYLYPHKIKNSTKKQKFKKVNDWSCNFNDNYGDNFKKVNKNIIKVDLEKAILEYHVTKNKKKIFV